MKKFAVLFLLSAFTLSFHSCKKDEDPDRENVLRYDGDNNTGPFLPAGYFEAAARFTPNETSKYAGRKLDEISWYLGPAPATCIVKVYGPGTNNAPGALLYEAEVTNNIRTSGWNRHRLSPQIEITGEDLWLSIAFTHSAQQQSIGCDAGPRKANGDFLFRDSNNQWTTYQALTQESVNWNIRGLVVD